MQSEYSKRPGFGDWYAKTQEEMRADKILDFLNKKRREAIHLAVVQVRGRHRAEVIEQLAPIQDSISVILTKAEGTVVQSASPIPEVQPSSAPSPSGTTQFMWTFEELPDMDVLGVADEILIKLQRLVLECTKRFG
jgi:hypothetical protein